MSLGNSEAFVCRKVTSIGISSRRTKIPIPRSPPHILHSPSFGYLIIDPDTHLGDGCLTSIPIVLFWAPGIRSSGAGIKDSFGD